MLRLRAATESDVPAIFELIGELAEYERLRREMVGSLEDLRRHLFAEHRYAQVTMADWDGQMAGFALYFFNYSTFFASPACIWRICSCVPNSAAAALGWPARPSSSSAHASSAAAASNGRCWTGTRAPSISTSIRCPAARWLDPLSQAAAVEPCRESLTSSLTGAPLRWNSNPGKADARRHGRGARRHRGAMRRQLQPAPPVIATCCRSGWTNSSHLPKMSTMLLMSPPNAGRTAGCRVS